MHCQREIYRSFHNNRCKHFREEAINHFLEITRAILLYTIGTEFNYKNNYIIIYIKIL